MTERREEISDGEEGMSRPLQVPLEIEVVRQVARAIAARCSYGRRRASVHCEQTLARIDDFLEPLVTDVHSRRESALVDDEFASEGERLVAQSFRSGVLEALRQGASISSTLNTWNVSALMRRAELWLEDSRGGGRLGVPRSKWRTVSSATCCSSPSSARPRCFPSSARVTPSRRTKSATRRLPARWRESGNFLIPTLLGHPYRDKPPVLSAAIAILFRSNGEPSIGLARLPCAVAAVAGAILLYGLGCTLTERRAALLAALGVLGVQGYQDMARTARPDMIFTLAILTAALASIRALEPSRTRRAALGFAVAGAACTVASLLKGPLAWAFCALFPYLAWLRATGLRFPASATGSPSRSASQPRLPSGWFRCCAWTGAST